MVDHEYIDQFVEKHGHVPWIICGDPEYGCLLVDGDDDEER